MGVEKMKVNAVDAEGKWLYRSGGISALILGIAYVITIPLFAHVGPPPSGGEVWLKYLEGKTTVWWTILGLAVLTDFLFVPVALSLYLALKGVNRNAMLVATAFVGLFVVLDLAVTWTNYASSSRSAVYMPQPRAMFSVRATSRLQIMRPQCWHPARKFSTQ
jgi:hypothetical protein